MSLLDNTRHNVLPLSLDLFFSDPLGPLAVVIIVVGPLSTTALRHILIFSALVVHQNLCRSTSFGMALVRIDIVSVFFGNGISKGDV